MAHFEGFGNCRWCGQPAQSCECEKEKTMDKIDYDQLKLDVKVLENNGHIPPLLAEMLTSVLQQAKADAGKFDVLQHLRDGGRVCHAIDVNKSGPAHLYVTGGELAWECPGAMEPCGMSPFQVLMDSDDWQPHTPPIEDQLEDGQLYLMESLQCAWTWKQETCNWFDGEDYWGFDAYKPQLDSKGRPIKCGPVDNGE